jgi:mRNA interferase MazF
MEKDFKEWHTRKERLHNETPRAFFHEREVWWCSLGANIGFEQDGKGEKFARPVLVFKKFNNEIFWALPLSLQIKTKKATVHFYANVFLEDEIPRTALLSQLRLIDGKRLLTKVGMISEVNYSEIQKAVIRLCSI